MFKLLTKNSQIYKNDLNNELEIDSVVHKYGEKKVLTNIFMKCNTGDIIGLVGLNGCGKSTLLNIIFGTLKADFQNVRVNQKKYDKLFSSKNMIAYMTQQSFLPKNITVKDCIELMIKDRDKQQELLSESRLSLLTKTKIRNLSGGELRYLEFMLVMSLDTKFVLLDEPFSEIEPLYQKKLKEVIKENSKTKGIILTDHNYHEVLDVSTSNIIIKNGTTVAVKDLNDLRRLGYIL